MKMSASKPCMANIRKKGTVNVIVSDPPWGG